MSEQNIKSFWERPEGTTGKLMLWVLGAGALWVLYTALPWIITLAQNTITAVALLAVLFAMVFVLLDPKFQNFVSYMYKVAMRGITGAFIKLDPVAILETYISDLKKSREDMAKKIGELRGGISNLRNQILRNKEDMQDNLRLADAARDANKEQTFILQTRKAGRLEKSNKRLEDLYFRMQKLYEYLVKMHENSGSTLEDIVDQVKVAKEERAMVNQGHSAFRSALKILSGNHGDDMYDGAMDFIVEDAGNKMGEIENFMTMSGSFMDSIDLQNGVYQDDGIRMLDEWEKGNSSSLLITNNAKPLGARDVTETDKVLSSSSKQTDNKYSSLI
jgi:hypothetical protein